MQLTKVSPKAKNEGGGVNKYKEKDRINTKFNFFDFTLYFKPYNLIILIKSIFKIYFII